MANIQSLAAKKRERSGTGVSKRLRRSGRVPAVIYGGHQDTYGVDVSLREIGNLLLHSATDNVLVRLNIDGAREQDKLALVQDVQHHPISGVITHVDFRAVRETDQITANVPLELVGESEGVHLGGILDQQWHSLEVRCLPKDLPEKLEVDISALAIGDAIHIGQVPWPDGVEAVLGSDVVVAAVVEVRVGSDEEEEESEEPAVGAAAGSEAEV